MVDGRVEVMAASLDGADDDSEGLSMEESDHGNDKQSTPIPQTIATEAGQQNMLRRRPEKRPRKAPMPRQLVDEEQIVQLVKAYRIEFAIFCKGKKQVPKQMIPGKVWEKIYFNHFKQLFPDCEIEQDTLKKHLREQLGELGTGVADNGQEPVLQEKNITMEVIVRDCSPTRSILRLQENLQETLADGPPPTVTAAPPGPITSSISSLVPPVQDPLAGTATISEQAARTAAAAPTQVSTPTSGSASDVVKRTKSEMLNRQSDAICSIAKHFQDASQKHCALMDAKRAKLQLALLKTAKEYGVIDEQEFKNKLKELLKF